MGSLLLAAALVTETEGGSDRGGEKTTWSTPAQSKKALHLTFITASPITPQDPAPSPAMAPADLLALLQPHGQQHLLDHWDDLDAKQQEVFRAELTALDLKEVCGYFARTAESMKNTTEKLDDKMHPLQESQCGAVVKSSDRELASYANASYEEISKGKVGILLLAGGQGTRLGTSYPKGMYNVGLPSKKTLFQLQAERIRSLQQLAEARTGRAGKIAWYIMTSASTVKPTSDFFEQNNYFGLDAENVFIFQQGTLPCFTFEGKIILGEKGALSRAPDGNGGLYRALRNEGVLADMKLKGVKFIQLYCVDNVLVKVGDPVFMGYCLAKEAECANKVVRKGFPTEAVGITCKVDDHYQVVEYSEITQKSAEKRNKDGSLVYGAANICIHFFTFEFLERVVMLNEDSLQHHVAKKKIPFVDASGSIVKPEKPNGIKMEKFVFDVFQFAKNFVVWECLRDEEFAPLKNAEGASDFTPTHCRNALLALHQKWLRIAGARLLDSNGKEARQMGSPAGEDNNNDPDNNNDEKGYVVMAEISPLVSYAGENLEGYKGKSLQLPLSIN